MSVTHYPYQDFILRHLHRAKKAGASQIGAAILDEGQHEPHGHDSPQVHSLVADNLDHLEYLEMTEYTGGPDREAQLTDRGREAAASLP